MDKKCPNCGQYKLYNVPSKIFGVIAILGVLLWIANWISSGLANMYHSNTSFFSLMFVILDVAIPVFIILSVYANFAKKGVQLKCSNCHNIIKK